MRLVGELRAADPNDRGVITRVARQLGVGTESLRLWVKAAEADSGVRPGTTSDERGEVAKLRKDSRRGR